jgi:hypothetical protein
MSLAIPQVTLQRVVHGAALGSVTALFLTGEAAATLAGAVAGPFIAQAAGLAAVGATASALTLSAAALARIAVPRLRVGGPAGRRAEILEAVNRVELTEPNGVRWVPGRHHGAGVLVLGGSSGRVDEQRARLFAGQGCVAESVHSARPSAPRPTSPPPPGRPSARSSGPEPDQRG